MRIFLRDLGQFVFLVLVNRNMEKEEIESAIYGAFECFANTEPRIEYPARAPLKRLVSLFLEESGGRRIEFRITGENGRRALTVRRVSGAAQGSRPVVSVREAVEATASVSGEVLMRLLYRKELMRYNASAKLRQAVAAFYRLYRGCVRSR